jgi:hypothetical protein
LASRPFPHDELNREVDAISGHYVITDEHRVVFQGRELLYLVGYGIVDTSCCGTGGCGYALVPGFVEAWKSDTDERGRPVSLVEPIQDEDRRRAISRWIMERETIQQVQFI